MWSQIFKREVKKIMKFNYATYATVSAANTANKQSNNNQKVNFFKLGDGESALVRFDVHSLDDLEFATIHRLGAANKWMAVSCFREFGSKDNSVCPFCKAIAKGNTAISKSSTRVYVKMIVRYFDKATGKPSDTIEAVVWDRPSGFAKELSSMINDYGDLTKHVFKVTRTGAKMDTKYSASYIPVFDKPEVIPEDFSAFNGYDFSKHLYWVKTKEEMEQFLTTGQFPERAKTVASNTYTAAAPATAVAAPTTEIDAVNPDLTKSTEQPKPVAPTRTFNKFTF